jgi:hypothetical protein
VRSIPATPEVLDHYRGVLADEPGAQLVQAVAAGVGDRCGVSRCGSGSCATAARAPVACACRGRHDPAYANPRNEIWLDFTADRLGTGVAVSRVAWPLGDRRPKSVVIHETHTNSDPGRAGTAGARQGCVNVDF